MSRVNPDSVYEEKEIVLSPGESILFVSDGVTEAENEQGNLFGDDRVIQYLRKAAGPPWGKGLLKAVHTWRGGAKANDDLTLLEIWRE